VSSRKEQKEALRRERLAREQAAVEAKARRRRFQIGGGVIALVAVIVVAIILIGGGNSNKSGANGSKPTASASSATSGTQAGVETGTAPWPPEYSFLAQRLGAFNFPQQTDFGYHVHAVLFVYVNGKKITVPANFGIDPQGRFLAPVHTHDTTGIIHMESAKPYPFTLGEAFDIWGVKFSDTQLGAYQAGNGNVLQLWVNGKQVSDPFNYKMKPHDVMIVGYGKPGSFPHSKQFSFPSGL
jgi:hypothetical protein